VTGRALSALVALLVVTATLSFGGAAQPAPGIGVAASQPGATITVGSGPSADGTTGLAGAPGERVTVLVRVNASGVAGYQTNLTFDPAVVRVVGVSGAEPGTGTGTFADPVSSADGAGWVTFNQLRAGGADDPVLVALTLEVVGEPGATTNLSFVRGATVLATDGATKIPVERYEGTSVSVLLDSRDLDGDGVYEDVNGNGERDFDDVVTYFESLDTDAVRNYPLAYDFNGNREVDFDDVVTLFGSTSGVSSRNSG
jgi:PKD repeat protein